MPSCFGLVALGYQESLSTSCSALTIEVPLFMPSTVSSNGCPSADRPSSTAWPFVRIPFVMVDCASVQRMMMKGMMKGVEGGDEVGDEGRQRLQAGCCL